MRRQESTVIWTASRLRMSESLTLETAARVCRGSREVLWAPLPVPADKTRITTIVSTTQTEKLREVLPRPVSPDHQRRALPGPLARERKGGGAKPPVTAGCGGALNRGHPRPGSHAWTRSFARRSLSSGVSYISLAKVGLMVPGGHDALARATYYMGWTPGSKLPSSARPPTFTALYAIVHNGVRPRCAFCGK